MNLKTRITLFPLFFVCALFAAVHPFQNAYAQDRNEMDFHIDFREANTTFGEKAEYQTALDAYLAIAEQRGLSANLAFNIASCYYKLGQWGQSRLYLERMLLLKPQHPDAKNNLNVLLEKLALEEPEPRGLTQLAQKMDSNTWLLAGFILLISPFCWFFLTKIVSVTRAKSNKLGLTFCTVSSLLFVIGAGSIFLSIQNAKSCNNGIVVTETATLRQSPFDQAEVMATIEEGRKIQILKSHTDYFLCLDASTSTKGWISKQDLKPVIPSSGNSNS